MWKGESRNKVIFLAFWDLPCKIGRIVEGPLEGLLSILKDLKNSLCLHGISSCEGAGGQAQAQAQAQVGTFRFVKLETHLA